ncbi:Protein TSSC1 [Trichoplax sp. H2]|nr:Protein TSSC1 [Trichoplax sp. H2]|eukprot:RDD47861.1 Protein TSSC1 [Trichoplax sp. H2]
MDDDSAVIYGLEFQARALCAVVGDIDHIQFLVGTQSFKNDNQVHLIEFDEENNVINSNVYLHPIGEVWHISSCPLDKEILLTCYDRLNGSKTNRHATAWKIPTDDEVPTSPVQPQTPSSHTAQYSMDSDLGGPTNTRHSTAGMSFPPLVPKFHLSSDIENMKSVLWHPNEDKSTLMSVHDQHLQIWDFQVATSASAKVLNVIDLGEKSHLSFSSAAWNPHHNGTQVAGAYDTNIKAWDLRAMKPAYTIENAHGILVRDLDFNPNKPYYVVSCGDDCQVKFWDVRNSTEPLLKLTNHSHWVWSVSYNHFHDQLVLSSSSDSRVMLFNIISLSSEPFGQYEDIDDEESTSNKEEEPPKDGIIATYEEHEDSVYASCWSCSDPWVFASLSYDGRLVINRVPRTEKFKILL